MIIEELTAKIDKEGDETSANRKFRLKDRFPRNLQINEGKDIN
jgi:hypothetical protein